MPWPATRSLRRRAAPYRVVEAEIVVARPSDGHAVSLSQTVADVWRMLDEETTVNALEAMLGERYPSIDGDERRGALIRILDQLAAEGLLEQPQS